MSPAPLPSPSPAQNVTAQQIVERAQAEESDLIVMPRRGDAHIVRWAAGFAAEFGTKLTLTPGCHW